jgi:hypothetical protein
MVELGELAMVFYEADGSVDDGSRVARSSRNGGNIH